MVLAVRAIVSASDQTAARILCAHGSGDPDEKGRDRVPGVTPNDRLAVVMGEAGMSRKALARAVRELSVRHGRPIGCDHTAVSRWLAGTQPRAQTVQLVAEALSA
jgi:hypothetical protein